MGAHPVGGILKKSKGKLKWFSMADLHVIPLTYGVIVISTIFFLKLKYVKSKWLSGKDGCKVRPQKPLLDLAFCIYLVRENSGEKNVKVNKGPASNNVLFSFRLCLQFMAPYLELLAFLSWGQSPRKNPQKNNCERNHSSVILFVETFLLREKRLKEK